MKEPNSLVMLMMDK